MEGGELKKKIKELWPLCGVKVVEQIVSEAISNNINI